MSTIQNRYASAVHSSNLGVDAKTRMSDSDTLGAYGLADRALTTGRTSDGTPVRPCPLAVPLERLFAGDNNAVYDIVRMLAEMAHAHSFKIKLKIKLVECTDLARACLAWHRDGTCKACEGRGYALIPGTKTLSDRECLACRGSRKIPFERNIKPEWRELARWMVSEMTRASGYAGPAAMRALAPSLNLE
jgi:hypothetical protein